MIKFPTCFLSFDFLDKLFMMISKGWLSGLLFESCFNFISPTDVNKGNCFVKVKIRWLKFRASYR